MKRRMKKIMTVAVTAAMAISMLAGCGSSDEKSEGSNAGSKEVNVICWTEYLPQEVLDSFEEKTGITVNMTTYTSPDDMLAKVQTSKEGTYDVIIGPENYMPIFSKLSLLEELDREKLPNFGNIAEQYLGRENDPENTYSVPYMFASAVIAVNTDVITDEITSYADLLKPDYKDKIVVIEDSRAMYAMAAMAQGCDDVNDTSDETLASVESYWKELFPNIHAFDGDSPKTLMINGECPIGLIYGAEALLAQQEVPSIKCFYPEEGVYLGSDSMMITGAAKNKDNAYELINYILDGEISASISEIFPYVNPNKAALEYLSEDYTKNELTNPPEDVVGRSCTLMDIGDEASKIVDLWTRLKG
ncbi:ABC transporter substrate-binding protein [Frisingicoccus sp.]|uniref:ABC transporter substrate-binding protein n=1 Tax=Frisingicoccus sp. TaxID=1918627 RepID=UPI003AB57E26